jgi:hypothetical protein
MSGAVGQHKVQSARERMRSIRELGRRDTECRPAGRDADQVGGANPSDVTGFTHVMRSS